MVRKQKQDYNGNTTEKRKGQQAHGQGLWPLPLSLDHMQGIFVVLGVGFVGSLSVFAAEGLKYRYFTNNMHPLVIRA